MYACNFWERQFTKKEYILRASDKNAETCIRIYKDMFRA